MIEAGEDARFIARRLVILASEDVGLADPMALPIATAAAQAVEFVGLPEAMHNLSHAVIYLANAPKSNGAKAAIGAALADVRDRPAGDVPSHLRDASYKGAGVLGPRRGVRLSSRLARWLGAPAVPTARGGGPRLLGAERPRRRP